VLPEKRLNSLVCYPKPFRTWLPPAFAIVVASKARKKTRESGALLLRVKLMH
jgi:hypothetical protein